MHSIRYRRILATFGGAAALSFLLAACSSNATESHTPKPDVTHSAEATPTPTADSSEVFQTEPIAEAPAIVQQLEAMPMETDADIAAFNAIPKADQLTWLSWATNNNIPDYAAQYEAESGKPSDIYPTTISINNTPAEALTIGHFNTYVASSMSTPAAALKALITSLPNGINDGGYQVELGYLSLDTGSWIPDKPAANALAHGNASSVVTNNPSLETDSEGRQFMDIKSTFTGTNGMGNPISGNQENYAYFYTYKNFKGVEESTWLTS